MPTYTKNWVRNAPQYDCRPYGNYTELLAELEFDSAGELVNFEGAVTPAPADVLIPIELPMGFAPSEAVCVVSTAAGQAATITVGHKFIDGVDDAAHPEGTATIFSSAVALNAAARTRMTAATKIVPLPKRASLIVTIAGTQIASACKVQITIKGILTGAGNLPA